MKGIFELEHLVIAHSESEKLGLIQLQEKCLTTLQSYFPKNEKTLHLLYARYLEQRQYELAEDLAQGLGLEFDAMICRAFKLPEIDVSELITYASRHDKLDQLCIAMAQEMEFRENDDDAKYWATKITPKSRLEYIAIQIRCRVIGRNILRKPQITDADITEIKYLMDYVSRHPTDLETRFGFETLLESQIELPSATLVLTQILHNSIIKSSKKILTGSNPPKRSEKIILDDNQPAMETFLTEFSQNYSAHGYLLGHGELPEEIRSSASVELADRFLLIISEDIASITSEEKESLLVLAQCLILLCRQLNEPSKDFLALLLIIGALPSIGFAQEARDVAETSFQL